MTNRSIINQFAVIYFIIFLTSCNLKDNKLKNYYENNINLHQELSDSLMNFSKTYKTDVVLQKINYPEKAIRFEIHFHDRAEFLPVFFDTALNRRDYDFTRTGNYIIPKTLIEKFNRSIYIGIGSDSTYTFFAYQWDTKYMIGTHGDLQYGILVLKDTAEITKRDKKISKNACISHYGIF